MNYHKEFRVAPGSKIRLKDFAPPFSAKDEKKKTARREVQRLQKRMDDLQFQLDAENKRSLLICLQALDAGGKDGVVRQVIGSMNPQDCRVAAFKQPAVVESASRGGRRGEKKEVRRTANS